MPVFLGATLTLLGCAGALLADSRGARRARGALKLAASLGFIIVGFASWHAGAEMSLLRVGLLAAAAGDAALIGRDERALLAGIAAFGAAHLAYSAAFISRIAARPESATWLVLACALAAAGGALCFCLSDVAVARDRLLGPSPADRRWGLPLYYVAQLLLAWAAATGF